MSAGPAVIVDPPARLTWKELCEHYPDQWVMLVCIDNVSDTDFEFRSALLIGHGPGRRELFARVGPTIDRYMSFGCFFTGPIRAPLRRYPAAQA